MCPCSLQPPVLSWLKPGCAAQSLGPCSRGSRALHQDHMAAPWDLPSGPVCWTGGGRALGGGVFLLETSPSTAWVGADALPCVGAGFWLTRLCRHIPGKQLLALMPSRELCSPGDWWQHHQGGTEPCCWLSSLRLVMELLRPPFSILRISLAPRSERSHRSV